MCLARCLCILWRERWEGVDHSDLPGLRRRGGEVSRNFGEEWDRAAVESGWQDFIAGGEELKICLCSPVCRAVVGRRFLAVRAALSAITESLCWGGIGSCSFEVNQASLMREEHFRESFRREAAAVAGLGVVPSMTLIRAGGSSPEASFSKSTSGACAAGGGPRLSAVMPCQQGQAQAGEGLLLLACSHNGSVSHEKVVGPLR